MDLKVAQARYRFGLLSGDDLVAAAVRLIEDGADNPTACELACLNCPTLRDAGPMFERILGDLGIPTLSATEARNIAAADIGQAIVTGAVRPRDGLSEIEALWEASGSLEDLWPSIPWGFYDDEWPENRAENAACHAEVDASVVEAAWTMLARLPPGSPKP